MFDTEVEGGWMQLCLLSMYILQ